MPVEPMFPENPEFPLIHTRRYEVRAFRMADDRFLLRGVVCDEKPAGLYVTGDPDPLWLHHMIVEMEVVYPTFRAGVCEISSTPAPGMHRYHRPLQKAGRHVDRERL